MKKILRFTASWCGPCKMMAKTLEQIETNVPIEVIDIDVHPEIATEYGIRGVPTLVMMEENMATKRIVGNKTKQELEEFINGT
jgi:thioredoxin 1